MGRPGPPLSLRLWEGRGAAGRGQVSAVAGCDVAGGIRCGAETQRRGRRGASCRPRAVAGGRGHRASITDSSGRGHGQTPALCTVRLSRSGRVARGRRRALLPPRPARTAADTPGHAAGFPPRTSPASGRAKPSIGGTAGTRGGLCQPGRTQPGSCRRSPSRGPAGTSWQPGRRRGLRVPRARGLGPGTAVTTARAQRPRPGLPRRPSEGARPRQPVAVTRPRPPASAKSGFASSPTWAARALTARRRAQLLETVGGAGASASECGRNPATTPPNPESSLGFKVTRSASHTSDAGRGTGTDGGPGRTPGLDFRSFQK